MHWGSGFALVIPRRHHCYPDTCREQRGHLGRLRRLTAPFPAQHGCLVAAGPSQQLFRVSEILPPLRTGSLPGCQGPPPQPEPSPGGILSSTWHQAPAGGRLSWSSPPQDCISSGMKTVPCQDSLVRWGIGGQGGNASHPVCSLKGPTPPGTGQRGPWSQCQTGRCRPSGGGVPRVWFRKQEGRA